MRLLSADSPNWLSQALPGNRKYIQHTIRKRAMVQQPSFSSYITCAAEYPELRLPLNIEENFRGR